MKYLSYGFIALLITPAAFAQTKADWLSHVTMDGNNAPEIEGATMIDLDAAKALHDKGALFLDTRGLSSWERRHIAGSVSAPPYFNEEELLEIVGKDEEIVFYCNCENAGCNLSPFASARAAFYGYENVYYLTNLDEWEEAGLPIEIAN